MKKRRFPIFIVGSPRSGTSVLHWALCQHVDLWGSEESEFLVTLIRSCPDMYASGKKYGDRSWLTAEEVGYEEFCRCLGSGIYDLFSSRAGDCHWIDQTPGYTSYIFEVLKLFPDAKFLFIHRDGRQVIESMKAMFRWNFIKGMYIWANLNKSALAFESEHPEKILRISYESLVLDPNSVFKRVYGYLGLSIEPESARFVTNNPPINQSQKFMSKSTDKLNPRYSNWAPFKHYVFWLKCGAIMQSLGYKKK